MKSLLDYPLQELSKEVQSLGKAPFHAKQLYRWFYQKGVFEFDQMSDLSKGFREELKAHYSLALPEIATVHRSLDGTEKLLYRLQDGKTVESVIIPAVNDEGKRRISLCVSSQVGCALGCTFCNTARMGLVRNLKASEIVGQVVRANEHLKTTYGEDCSLTNLIFMGMGEPLHNYDELLSALHILVDEYGLNFSKRKITVSTSGLVPEIIRFGKEAAPRIRVNLAISLNGTTDEMRSSTMPINRVHNLEKLFEALKSYPLESNRRITFEYILMRGLNDTREDGVRLVELLKKVPSKINLIPYNEFPGSPYQRPTDSEVLSFQQRLLDKGITATVRISRGRDVFAACGMLNTALLKDRVS